MSTKLAGDYGIDAPYVPILSGLGALALFALAFFQSGVWILICALGGLLLLAQGFLFIYVTRRGKFEVWAEIITDLQLQGSERVLDVGCGRGMAMLTAAQDLPDGEVIGIDLWRSQDQSGNSQESTLANADLCGLANRVSVRTADMSDLPFGDRSFDVVIGNVAIQNIKDRQLREKTINEIVRVTKPGGQIRIVDIQYTKQYVQDLREAGCTDVSDQQVGWRMWYGNPAYAGRLVSATRS